MNHEQREALRKARDHIKELGDQSNEDEYLDSGDALDALAMAYDAIDALFTPTKEHAEVMVTLAKGGTAEREVAARDLQVPDLWNIAHQLPERQRDAVLETWHLAHDLLSHIREPGPGPKHIEVEFSTDPMDESVTECRTFEFDTSKEITAFRKGLQAAIGNYEMEIVYTDEELDDERAS